MSFAEGGLYTHMIINDIWGDKIIFSPTNSKSLTELNIRRSHLIPFLTYINTPPPLPDDLSRLKHWYPGIIYTLEEDNWCNHVSDKQRKSKFELDNKWDNCSFFDAMLLIFKCPPKSPLGFIFGSHKTITWFTVWKILHTVCFLTAGFRHVETLSVVAGALVDLVESPSSSVEISCTGALCSLLIKHTSLFNGPGKSTGNPQALTAGFRHVETLSVVADASIDLVESPPSSVEISCTGALCTLLIKHTSLIDRLGLSTENPQALTSSWDATVVPKWGSTPETNGVIGLTGPGFNQNQNQLYSPSVCKHTRNLLWFLRSSWYIHAYI